MSRKTLPFKDVVLTLQDGRKTITNEDGAFTFDNMQPGDYTVELMPQYLPEGYTSVGPTKWNVHVDPGATATDTNFTLDWKDRPIIFSELPLE